MAGGAAQSGRTVTSKVLAILMAFSRGGSHSLTELAGLIAHVSVSDMPARASASRSAKSVRFSVWSGQAG